MELPPLNQSEADHLTTYSVDSEESITTAIAEAFRTIDLDVEGEETVIADWIDVDALERLCRGSDRHTQVSTLIWGYPVVVTRREIRIFVKEDTRR